MPYKDPVERLNRTRARLEELRKDPDKWNEYLAKQTESRKKWRSKQTPEYRKECLKLRREARAAENPESIPRVTFSSDDERRAHERKYHAEYARKRREENPEKEREKQRASYRKRTQETIEKRRVYGTQNTRERRMIHPEAPAIYHKRNKDKWTGGVDCRDPLVWRLAEDKARVLIETLGYTDVFKSDFIYFYFDAAAKKDGHVSVFQITTLRTRQIKRKHIEMVNYFGWDYYLIQVKPNMEVAYITKIATDIVPDQKVVNYHYAKGIEYPLA